ncbi:uncharacterized protein isoform X1 [Castor canadensis]|uniref:Uncharacterized protein isoform X1 n=1 Tax=Castor canadensis TaxID=51338 RepID=A0AC58K3W7_CASCN
MGLPAQTPPRPPGFPTTAQTPPSPERGAVLTPASGGRRGVGPLAAIGCVAKEGRRDGSRTRQSQQPRAHSTAPTARARWSRAAPLRPAFPGTALPASIAETGAPPHCNRGSPRQVVARPDPQGYLSFLQGLAT